MCAQNQCQVHGVTQLAIRAYLRGFADGRVMRFASEDVPEATLPEHREEGLVRREAS